MHEGRRARGHLDLRAIRLANRGAQSRRSDAAGSVVTGALDHMEITCAGCGCRVDRGVIVEPCSSYPDCCCRDLTAGRSARLREAD